MKAITHTKIFATPLRFAMSLDALRKKERNIINRTITKATPPEFVDRANPDMPPAITEHVRELARVMKNRNSLIAHFTIPGLEDFAKHYMRNIVDVNDAPMFEKRTRTPNPNRVAVKMHFITTYSNIRPEDKPAFRHDSLFLFDTLSEDYNA